MPLCLGDRSLTHEAKTNISRFTSAETFPFGVFFFFLSHRKAKMWFASRTYLSGLYHFVSGLDHALQLSFERATVRLTEKLETAVSSIVPVSC